ncbi:MAG: TonB-dependent receptor plug domain-containing protein, partial [Myxococcales bacterium]|nr:TonB-dependent receptor plug domain-containing protein [Myxococcales bacterium]
MRAWLLAQLIIASAPEDATGDTPGDAAGQASCDRSWSARIVESDTDEHIPGARVVVRLAGRPPQVLRSDADGEVQLDGLCPGTLEIDVDKAEHLAAELDVELGPGETRTTIELEALHGHHSERVIVIHDEGSESVGASESLSGAELAKTRGQGLAAAIDGMAGVSTLRGSAGGMGKPIIRGQFGRRNLVIFDGIRHEGQEWGLDHAPEVDPQAADRITVVKGAGTTRFGPEASGGVVLLEPRPLPRQPGLSGEVGTFAFSNPLGAGLGTRLDYMPVRSRGLAFRVEGNLARHRAALTPDYALDNTGSLTWNVGARLGRSGEHVDVELGYHLMRQRLGICTCLRVASAEDFSRTIADGEPVGVELYRADFAIERPKQEIWHHLAFA